MSESVPAAGRLNRSAYLYITAGVLAAGTAGWAIGPPEILWMRGGHIRNIEDLAVSSDGALIATHSEDRSVKLWRTADGSLLRTHVLEYSGEGVALSPDKTLLAADDSKGLHLWRVSDGGLVRTIASVRYDGPICFSPDGLVIAAVYYNLNPRFYRVSDGQVLLELTGHSGRLLALCFSPDGQLLAGGGTDGKLFVWDAHQGALLRVLSGHTGYVYDLRFSNDGSYLASGGIDAAVRLWRVNDWSLAWEVKDKIANIHAVDFSSDSQSVVAGGSYAKIGKWRCADGVQEAFYSPDPNTYSVTSLRVLPDGNCLIAGYGRGKITQHRISDLTPQTDLTAHTAAVSAVARSPSGLAASVSAYAFATGSMIRLWRTTDGVLLRTIPGHKGDGLAVALSHDGELIASGGVTEDERGEIFLLRASDGTRLATLYGHAGPVHGLTFTSDDQELISGSWDYTIKFWSVTERKLLRTWAGHSDTVNAVARSPDGQWLASASSTGPPDFEGETLLWRLSDGAILRAFHGHAGTVNSVAFSPDGRWVATAGDDKCVQVYRTSDWVLHHTLTTDQGPVKSVGFSADSRTLIAGGVGPSYPYDYGELALWRVSTGDLLKTCRDETSPAVRAIAAATDGPAFFYGRDDGTIVMARNPHRIGDANCDAKVNFADINPFVLALGNRTQYESQYPGCIWLNSDVNENGSVSFEDINPFVMLLGRDAVRRNGAGGP